MATTYKDYYINYNGTRISNNEDTGLTAVNIYYNGTYLGEGAHTLNCAGQYMNGNVTIGARTLNCGGQYMNGNVQVTVGNRYKWYKYTSPLVYSQVTSTQSYYLSWTDSGSIIILDNINCSTAYIQATSYSFNSSNGHYSLSGGWTRDFVAYPYATDVGRDKYFSYPNQGSDCTTMFYNHWVSGSGSEPYLAMRPEWLYYSKPSQPGGGTHELTTYTSAGSHTQGDYVGTVQDTNPNAHSNGYNSDGYWYVAI